MSWTRACWTAWLQAAADQGLLWRGQLMADQSGAGATGGASTPRHPSPPGPPARAHAPLSARSRGDRRRSGVRRCGENQEVGDWGRGKAA
jgi:hypothetical protein